jgi:hypothetical protein
VPPANACPETPFSDLTRARVPRLDRDRDSGQGDARDGGKRLSFLPSEHKAVQRLLSLTGLDEQMNMSSSASASSAGIDDLVGRLLRRTAS